MDMKKILAMLLTGVLVLTTGCSNPFIDTGEEDESKEDPYSIKVLTKDELQDDTYYVKHGNQFYEIPYGDCNFDDNEETSGSYTLYESDQDGDASRSFFYSKNKTELLIPTMYADDQIVFKSSNAITDAFAWERYKDGGYTIGIRGISKSDNETFTFTNYYANIAEDSNFPSKIGRSDTTDEDEEGSLNSYTQYALSDIDGKKITEDQIDKGGFVKDIPVDKEITVNVFKGTHCFPVKTKADSRIFYNFENYYTKGVEYNQDGYAVITVPKSFLSGYYKVNNSGMVRYINQPYKEGFDITTINYNKAYFKLDDQGHNITTVTDKDGNDRYLYDTETTKEKK